MDRWKFVNIVMVSQPVEIDGVNVWDHKWQNLGREPFLVPHPSYPEQRHTMVQYQIKTGRKVIVFAAGEYSNNVWGFYVPE